MMMRGHFAKQVNPTIFFILKDAGNNAEKKRAKREANGRTKRGVNE